MFKLVRTDTEEANEIQLPEGTYLIGRGKLIGFEDKRISWNHGLIFVKEESVTIESSQRKIYLTKKGSKEKEVLNKTFKTTLAIGDRFGFLADSYWYEVQGSGNDRSLKEINENTLKSPHFTMEKSSMLSHSPEEEKPRKRKKELMKSGKRKLKRRRKDSEEEVSDDSASEDLSLSDEEENSPSSPAVKRERCKYGADCYSIRTLRRDNPAHQAHTDKYSHPRDDDWGERDLKMCPLGAACLRRGPRHARRFRHPPGHRIPPPVPRTKANKCWRRHTVYSESDSDSPERHIVLRSKRERKPLPKEETEDVEDLESEGEEDPFASDGSEDWKPELDDYL